MSAAILLSSFVATAAPPIAVKISDPDKAREQRGRAIASVTRITRQGNHYVVPSQKGNGAYRVILDPAPFVPMCTCKDYAEREKACKHVYAVRAFIERETSPEGSQPVSIPTTEDAPETLALRKTLVAPRVTYRQDWPRYNEAQINEKAKFLTLLTDLCRGVPEPAPNKKGGRPPLSMADRSIACILKIYTTISGRRASTDLRDARDKGHLSHAPHYSAVYRYLEDPAMTPVLMGLIAESARPLRAIECDFIVDSTGFSTSKFVRWYDHKYGVVKQEYDWVKVSLCTGRLTNVVAAVEVDERYAADCPRFAPLLKATAKTFTIREVSADSAYLSYDNADLVASLGGVPYFAFKSNTAGNEGGTLARMYHLYQFNREEYLKHYHVRSNVESTVSMIKAKFGDHVRSKCDRAMANEALCKVVCHNLCCCIQSTYELGLAATFWGKEDAAVEPTIEPAEVDPIEAYAWV